MAASRLVREVTGLTVQPNKAIVGRNAFAHEAGIHQHGVLNNTLTYEIMKPEDVGWTDSNLVLGKHSGKHALQARLAELGFDLTREELGEAFARFKNLCDRKKVIYDEDLFTIAVGEASTEDDVYVLEGLLYQGGANMVPTATALVRVDGELRTEAATGDGPVHASLEAIRRALGMEDVVLEDYHLDAITGGSDAQGKVHVRVKQGRVVAHGQAVHTDVVEASAEAFMRAINHLAFLKARRAELGTPAEPELALAGRGV